MSQTEISFESPKELSIDDLFKSFASDEDGHSDSISLQNIDKWFKQANLGEDLTTADLSNAFAKVAQNKNKITKEEFQEMLRELANEKDKSVEEIQTKLLDAGLAADDLQRPTDPFFGTGLEMETSDKDDNEETAQNNDEDGKEKTVENTDDDGNEKTEQNDEDGSGKQEGVLERLKSLCSCCGSQTDDDEDKDKGLAGQQDTTDASGKKDQDS